MKSKNIVKQNYQLEKKDRNKQKKHKSFVIWFTGLSGSGKSTLANAVEQKLFKQNCHTYVLDGDNIRSGLNKDLDFSSDARKENIRRIGEVAKLFVDAGIIVLTAFISPFRADRKAIKDLLGEENFIEVFVNCPVEICEQRDVKGLYKKARKGEIKNFTGIDSPFENPENPSIEIPTHLESLEKSIDKIMNLLSKNKIIN